jgi:hypothetical protein
MQVHLKAPPIYIEGDIRYDRGPLGYLTDASKRTRGIYVPKRLPCRPVHGRVVSGRSIAHTRSLRNGQEEHQERWY